MKCSTSPTPSSFCCDGDGVADDWGDCACIITDVDEDGIPEIDCDGDGFEDTSCDCVDFDGMNGIEPQEIDCDGDGLQDQGGDCYCINDDECDQAEGVDCDGDRRVDLPKAYLLTPPGWDTDGDGFSDGQEVLPSGVPGPNGGGLRISELGADPLVPDLFVELDWAGNNDCCDADLDGDGVRDPDCDANGAIDPGGCVCVEDGGQWGIDCTGPASVPDGQAEPVLGHDHEPPRESLESIVATFAAHGVALHIDAGLPAVDQNGNVILDGQGNPLPDPEFNLGGSQKLAHSLFLGGTCYDFEAIYFDKANRRRVFTYAVYFHRDLGTEGFSGGAEVGDGGADTLHLTSKAPENQQDPIHNFAAFFMHEYGHTLSLRHGGFDDVPGKFNYRSIVNYRYFPGGIDTDCQPSCIPEGDGIIDYSAELLATIPELGTDESQGVCPCAEPDPNDCPPPVAVNFNEGRPGDIGCPQPLYDFDWDGDRDRDGVESRNDWATLRFFNNSRLERVEEAGRPVGIFLGSCDPTP